MSATQTPSRRASPPKERLEPLNDMVVIRPLAGPRQSYGGVYYPDKMRQDSLPGAGPCVARCGEVVAVGPGRPREDGPGLVPMTLTVGETVWYHPLGGTEIEFGGEELRLMGQAEVIARKRV